MEKYLFFNSTQTDRRKHQASDIADYWQSFLRSGVITQDNDIALKVVAKTNRKVGLNNGRALIFGHLYVQEDTELTIPEPHATLNRIDRIVLRFDNTIENRYIKAFVLRGVASATPTAPELTRNSEVHEISLAKINVTAGKSTVVQADIVDERLNESVCGIASSLVSVPTDIFNAEFQAYMQQIANEWQAWFNRVANDTYITNTQFNTRNRQVDRQLANLNAIADIDNRAIGATDKFYDLFDGSNDKSVANLDETSTQSIENKATGSYSIKVIDAKNFKVGQQVTIYYTSLTDTTTLKVSETLVTAISGNQLTVTDTSEMASGALVTRTAIDSVDITSWSNPKKSNTTVYGSSDLVSVKSSQNAKCFIGGHPVSANNVYFINNDGSITKNNTTIYGAKISQSGEYLFYKATASSKDMIIAKIDYNNKTFTTFLTIVGNALGSNQYWATSSFEHIKLNGYDYFLTYKDYTNFTVSKYSNDTLVQEKNFTRSTCYGASMYYSKKRNKIVVGFYPTSSIIYELNIDTLDIENQFSVAVKSSQSGFSSITYHQYCVTNDTREYAIYTPKAGDVTNKVYQLIYFDDATQKYVVKEILSDTLTSSSDFLNVSTTKDGNFYLTMEKIYLLDKDFNSTEFLNLNQFRQSASLQHFCGFAGGTNNIFGVTGSTSYLIYKLTGVTNFKIPTSVLRYNFNQPLKNLAGWLVTKTAPSSVQASLSMVDNTQNESYKTLTVTKKDNEYEFLETANTVSKDKVTLKLSVNGGSLEKLLGAIE